MQTLEDLLRAPANYPEGLVGRNVSLAGDHEAAAGRVGAGTAAASNDSFPLFGGGGNGGYNGDESAGGGATAAGAAAANATQTTTADSAAELLGLNHTNDDIIKELVSSISSSRELQDVESKSHRRYMYCHVH